MRKLFIWYQNLTSLYDESRSLICIFCFFVSESKIKHLSSSSPFPIKGLGILARLVFYNLIPLLFLVVFSLKYSFYINDVLRKESACCLCSLWSFEPSGLIALTLVTLCFNFRRTLGNSLYCLPHRTGSFTEDLVRACGYTCTVTGHLTRWGGADPHNLLTSTSSA